MNYRKDARIYPGARFALAAALVGAIAATPAWAQYKVVQPDGSITYTDRPQVTATTRVSPLAPAGKTSSAGTSSNNELPLELRQAAQRYPVTIYTAKDCPACDVGRRFLQLRGIPYAERLVITEADAAGMDRLVGGRSVPTLSVGQQPLRGYSESDWTAYLDAAGYPRENRLPPNWPRSVAAPVVERVSAQAERVAPVRIDPSAPVLPPPPDPVNNPTGVRF